MSGLRWRTRPWLVLSWLAAHALACATTADGPTGTETESDPQFDEGTSAMNDISGGETGSMNPNECAESAECVEHGETSVALLTEPLVVDHELIGAECVEHDGRPENCCFRAPAACLCYYGVNGNRTRDRGNATILGNREDCDVYGRDHSCVSPASDFEGCDVEQPSSCDAACEALDVKIKAHQAQAFDAEVRFAECTESGACRIVLRIEDRCYANRGALPTAYDCALSDEDILANAYQE